MTDDRCAAPPSHGPPRARWRRRRPADRRARGRSATADAACPAARRAAVARAHRDLARRRPRSDRRHGRWHGPRARPRPARGLRAGRGRRLDRRRGRVPRPPRWPGRRHRGLRQRGPGGRRPAARLAAGAAWPPDRGTSGSTATRRWGEPSGSRRSVRGRVQGVGYRVFVAREAWRRGPRRLGPQRGRWRRAHRRRGSGRRPRRLARGPPRRAAGGAGRARGRTRLAGRLSVCGRRSRSAPAATAAISVRLATRHAVSWRPWP